MEVWKKVKVERDLTKAFRDNSEQQLLRILKNNSFLFYELFDRKYGIQPVFYEVSFGGQYRCDFAWMNDHSAGPEWTLLEVERPKMKVFNKSGKPSSYLNNAIEQVRSWQRYFSENPSERRRIFRAVAKFRYILVAGDSNSWGLEGSMKWRNYHNSKNDIIIRTSDIFKRSLKVLSDKPEELWSFAEHPQALNFSELYEYYKDSDYLNKMRKFF